MTELERFAYETVVKTEYMSEGAFLTAWNDYKCYSYGVVFAGHIIDRFIKWLL